MSCESIITVPYHNERIKARDFGRLVQITLLVSGSTRTLSHVFLTSKTMFSTILESENLHLNPRLLLGSCVTLARHGNFSEAQFSCL